MDGGGIWRKWRPLEPPRDFAFDFGEFDALSVRWRGLKARLIAEAPDALAAAEARLYRRWSIETGYIERIYAVDAPASERLVREGFREDLIPAGAADTPVDELVAILRDQEDGLRSAIRFAEEGWPFGKWAMQSLHAQMLANQSTSVARDQFGRLFKARLTKGEFKRRPNNPTRADGSVHEYCPPEQVESELDALMSFYFEWSDRVHPVALGAWLHHGFICVHPFQDGNGRVGRAVLAWHMARCGLPPLVVSRYERTAYINALEAADAGDLEMLAGFFARLERESLADLLAAGESALGG